MTPKPRNPGAIRRIKPDLPTRRESIRDMTRVAMILVALIVALIAYGAIFPEPAF